MERLDELPVTIFDCQATSATPQKGALIDLAWARCIASESTRIESTLVSLPPEQPLPPRVARLTGISEEDLHGAPAPAEVATQLTRALDVWESAFAVAHWARYERVFVHDLLGVELDWLCTHDLARRLVPGLPRKGLRAVAGYFGRPLDESKRAFEHVDATVFVWRELVGLLAEEGVETLEELWRWLEKPVRKTDERTYPLPRETRLQLPEAPGVYRMLGRDGRVLYVGKATSLKQRVNSYFRQRKLAEHKMELVSQVWDLDVTVTESAFEAALLETDEIKRFAPPYNRQLREEGRALAWANPENLRDVRPRPDEHHTLGPFSSRSFCEHFAEVIDFLRFERPLSYLEASDFEAALGGLALFREKHPLDEITVTTLIELGGRLHPLPEATDDDGAAEVAVEATTPESILALLEHSVVGLYRTTARSRWLQKLSTSSIRWQPTGSDHNERTVELHAGFLAPPDEVNALSVETYDRLSVVLRELRRILRDGRHVRVVVGDLELGVDELTEELARF